MGNIVDGIYDDGCGIYFNYNICIPDGVPDDIKALMEKLGDSLKAGRVQEFLGEMELVEVLVKSAHAARAISAREASRIMSVLGWEYHGAD